MTKDEIVDFVWEYLEARRVANSAPNVEIIKARQLREHVLDAALHAIIVAERRERGL